MSAPQTPASAPPPQPGFFARLGLALRVLSDATLAARLLEEPAPTTPPAQLAPAEREVERVVEEKIVEKVVEVEKIVEKIVEKVVEKSRPPEEGALHLLSILQRDGRFLDFLQEDIKGFKDQDIGGAARLVHEGCKKSLDSYFVLAPVRTEDEGARVTVEVGFDPHALRLAGSVKGEPPYQGTLTHAGWLAKEVKLPERPAAIDARIVAPAEVEVKG
jgi:hypothetical protein